MILKNLFIRVCVFLFSLTILLSFNDQTLINQLTDFNKQTIKYTDHGLSQFYIPKGLLNISEMNGNVIYSYPISKSNINGSDINVTLNYNGSVQHTAYLRCIVENSNVQDDWVRVKQNRPLWIMGVNGFAVQAFTEKNLFFCNPIWMEKLKDSANVYDDKFVWTVDGYDVCNSMNSIYKKDGQDEIKLLKADGSLLVLKNSYVFKQENDYPCMKDFYSGYYYTEEPNSKIWAFVDFKSEPNRNSYYELLEDSLKLSINNGCYDSCEVMGYNYRRVYLFNDDGLVYVFREDKVPYGTFTYKTKYDDIFDTVAVTNYSIGYTSYRRGLNPPHGDVKTQNISSPSIFYLESIYGQNQKSLEFKYEDFIGDGINQYNVGRMKLKEFNGHNISYFIDGNTGFTKDIVINSLGRDIALMMNIVKKDGFGAIESYQRPRKINDEREIMLTTIKNNEMYSSLTNYITQIKDDGLIYDFNYEQYTKKIVQNNIFCVDSTAIKTPNYFWNNYRLTLIKEPISEYTLTYKTDLIYSGIDDTNYRFALNNHINKVKTKGLLSDSLKTETYSYAIGNGSLGNGMFQTCKTIIDHKNGDLHRSIHSTFVDDSVDFDCFEFVDVKTINHVYLSSVIDSVANSPHYFKTEYIKKRINDSSFYFVDSVIKTYEVFNGKQFLTSYKYKNYHYTNGILNFKKPVKDSSVYNNYWVDFENKMGLKLVSDTTIDYYPNDLTKIVQKEINTYSNFKEETFTPSEPVMTLMRYATLDSFYLERLKYPDLVFEDYMCENGVYDNISAEFYRYFIPPFYELHTSSKLIDSNNILIKGIGKNINNSNYENGMLTLTKGLILNDTSYGKDGQLSFVNNYQYFGLDNDLSNTDSKSNRMPKETINPNGLKLNFYYELYRMDDLNLNTKCGDNKVIYGHLLYSNNPVIDSIELSNFFYEQFHSKPIYENIDVRKIDASGAITSKSLATKYSRDMFGNPLIISDQNDWASLLKYDNLNRLTLLNMPGDIWDRKTSIRINTPQVLQPYTAFSNSVADFWFHCAMIDNIPSSRRDTVYHEMKNDRDIQIGFNSIVLYDYLRCRCWEDQPGIINSDEDNTYQENQYPGSKQVYKQPKEKLQYIDDDIPPYDTYNHPYPVSTSCHDSSIYHRNFIKSFQLNLEKPQYCDEIFSLDSIKISLSITHFNNIQTIVDVNFLTGYWVKDDTIKTIQVSIEPDSISGSTISNFDIVITPGYDSLSRYQFNLLKSKINENNCFVTYSTATEGSLIKIHNDLSFKSVITYSDSVQYAYMDGDSMPVNLIPLDNWFHKPLVYYYGSFDMKYSDKDYTVKQRFGKNYIEVFEKIDDSYNSSNEGLSYEPLNSYFFRDKLTKTVYDHFNKPMIIHRKTKRNNSEQYDSCSKALICRNGYGNVYFSKDPFNYDKEVVFDGYGNTLKTIDEIGTEVNYDYKIDEPVLLGINPADQDFFGYCKLKTERRFFVKATLL